MLLNIAFHRGILLICFLVVFGIVGRMEFNDINGCYTPAHKMTKEQLGICK